MALTWFAYAHALLIHVHVHIGTCVHNGIHPQASNCVCGVV